MAHGFPPTIQWDCVRDIIAAFRKGDLTTDEKIDVGQHFAWFWGSSLEWYRQQDDDTKDGTLLAKLLAFISGGRLFGDENAAKTTDELCDECEAALPGDGEYEALPWMQILSIVVPIILELLKRLDNEDDEQE